MTINPGYNGSNQGLNPFRRYGAVDVSGTDNELIHRLVSEHYAKLINGDASKLMQEL